MLALTDSRATDARLTGAKAANLALANAAGLPVIPGFVVTTATFDPAAPGRPEEPLPEALDTVLRGAWGDIAAGGAALVVRSSSTVEDVGSSSMAGQFQSCLDVVGWDAFEAAVREVLGSSLRPVGAGPPGADGRPGATAGRRSGGRCAVRARPGDRRPGAHPRGGRPRGSRVPRERDRDGAALPFSAAGGDSSRVPPMTANRLSSTVGTGGASHTWQPGTAGRSAGPRTSSGPSTPTASCGCCRVARSRPSAASEPGGGPLLGPGPIGETFPEPLRALEEDLWLDPLRSGISSAITLVGASSRRTVAASPLVTTVSGRVACDLDLLGASPTPASGWRWLDPRVPARRLASAWRVGRLRAVLPELAGEVCRRVDGELAGLGPLSDLSDAELLEVLCRVRAHLAAVHGHEILAGTLLQREAATTGAGVAMSVVGRGRALGLSDDEIVVRWPVALALTAPRIGDRMSLPPTIDPAPGEHGAAGATSRAGGRPAAAGGIAPACPGPGRRWAARTWEPRSAAPGQAQRASGHDLVVGEPQYAAAANHRRRDPGSGGRRLPLEQGPGKDLVSVHRQPGGPEPGTGPRGVRRR